jgi:hypothetical protein
MKYKIYNNDIYRRIPFLLKLFDEMSLGSEKNWRYTIAQTVSVKLQFYIVLESAQKAIFNSLLTDQMSWSLRYFSTIYI